MSTPLVEPERTQTQPGLEIAAGPLVGGGRLVQDYLAGAPALAPFFTGHFGDIDAYRRKAADVDARFNRGSGAALASAIRSLGDAADRLGDVLSGNGYFVTTGQ